MKEPRAFGIGFHKTGTTTLAHALYSVGYRVAGWERAEHLLADELDRDEAMARLWSHFSRRLEDHDAAQDTPWFLFYRQLDERFPGSRFILTIRDPDRWVRSVTGHFAQSLRLHRCIYGVETSSDHEARLVEVYERHNREVKEYFSDRPGDLLVIDLTAGEGWGRLAPFLGVPEPPFPMATLNRATEREGARSLVARVRDVVAPLLGGRPRFLEALALYDACYFTLESVAGAPLDPLHDPVFRRLVDSTRDAIDELRLTLGLQAVARTTDEGSPAAAWQRQDTVIRNTIGAVSYADLRRRTPLSGRRVDQVARDLIGTVARVGAELPGGTRG